jgi:hypothetical protein
MKDGKWRIENESNGTGDTATKYDSQETLATIE